MGCRELIVKICILRTPHQNGSHQNGSRQQRIVNVTLCQNGVVKTPCHNKGYKEHIVKVNIMTEHSVKMGMSIKIGSRTPD
jgi:hypothetical protein